MRNELKAIGEGFTLGVYGQVSKRSGSRRVVTGVHSIEYGTYLADHLCVDLVNTGAIAGDMVAFTGTIYKYRRSDGTDDYSLNDIKDIVMCSTWLYHNTIVFTQKGIAVWHYNTQGQHIVKYYRDAKGNLQGKNPFDVYKGWLRLIGNSKNAINELSECNIKEIAEDYTVERAFEDKLWLKYEEQENSIVAYKNPIECLNDALNNKKRAEFLRLCDITE